MLRSELYKAFHNRGTYIAFLVGIVFAMLAFFVDDRGLIDMIIRIQRRDEWGMIYRNKENIGIPIYACWLGMRSSSYRYILYFVMPLLCVLPHGMSYCKDIKSGYINQILSRVDCKKYYGAKLLSVMISGGCVCASPLIINFILCMCVFPFTKPILGSGYFNIFNTNVLSELFSEHAQIYVCVYILFVFMYLGLVSAISLGITCFDQNIFITMSTPFIILFTMHTICVWLLGRELMSPIRIIGMNEIYKKDVPYILIEILIIIVLTIPFTMKMFRKKGDII